MEKILTWGFLKKVNVECAWWHDNDDDYYDDNTVENFSMYIYDEFVFFINTKNYY